MSCLRIQVLGHCSTFGMELSACFKAFAVLTGSDCLVFSYRLLSPGRTLLSLSCFYVATVCFLATRDVP
jgi:hypothetical protein